MKSLSPLVVARILLVALLLATVACQPDDPAAAGPGSAIRDSTGIRIIENASPPPGSRLDWRIGPEPTVSIGEVDGEDPYLLQGARDATRLGDGRIVVADVLTQELRVFDARGIHIETWGGAGEGPGEFTGLWEVGRWSGDSVFAGTRASRDISIFASDGSFGRTLDIVRHAGPLWTFFSPVSVTKDGSVLTVLALPTADTLVAELRDGEGTTIANFGSHPNLDRHTMTVDGRASHFRKIFGRSPVLGVWGDLVVIGITDRYELKAFAADGSLERIVRRAHVPRPPTQAEIATFIDDALSDETSGMSAAEAESVRRFRRPMYESVPAAERFPVFASIIADALDHLWVEEYEPPGEERPGSLWTVFDPEGHALGFVETPDAILITEIGEDYILTWIHDELGVERVQLWPLVR